MAPNSFVPMLQMKRSEQSFKRHGYKKVITAQPEVEFRSLDPISDRSHSFTAEVKHQMCVRSI